MGRVLKTGSSLISGKKILSLGVLLASFALFFNGRAKQQDTWLSCYKETSNRIHFKSLTGPLGCKGRTSFRGPKNYELIRNKTGAAFTVPVAGTKRSLTLKNGREVLATQWKSPGKSNRVIIVEPNMRSGKVKRHCIIKNAGDAYATRFNSKINTLQIQVLQKKSKKLKRVWRNCHL